MFLGEGTKFIHQELIKFYLLLLKGFTQLLLNVQTYGDRKEIMITRTLSALHQGEVLFIL